MTTATDAPASDASPRTEHRIDGWLHRYSRWKRDRLVGLDETPLATMGVRTLYLCSCILLDGVMLPWAVEVVAGGFSYPLFAVLVLPTIVVESLLYQKMKARGSESA